MGKYLDICRKFEAKRAQERISTPASEQQSSATSVTPPVQPEPTPWPCPHCGKPAVIEAGESSRDGTRTLTYWRCGPCQVWAVTPATETAEPRDSRTPPPGEMTCQTLYQEMAEAAREDC